MRHALRLPSLSRLLTVLVVAVVVTALIPAAPASAKTVKIDKRLFGLHDGDPRDPSWPAVSPGSIRLWDSGVSWAELEPSQGAVDWSRLDAIVAAANARGAEVTLVLGQTPAWADDPALDGVGPQYMPRMDAWKNHVAAVASRYKGRIKAYQVWNEANIVNYWAQNRHNTPFGMARLTDAAYGTIKSIDPSALVVGPAFATRLSWQRTYLRTFFGSRVSGVPVWKRMDAISLNLYPTADGTPESSLKLLKAARASMALRGVPASKPIWNSEINYGLATGGSGASTGIPASKQASYVVRTYLLNAAQKVKRVHWYMWDRPEIGSTKMVAADRTTPTLAGRAFGLVQGWMLGGKLVGPTRSSLPCTKDKAGTYTCVIKYRGGVKRVYWNPNKRVKIRTAKSATFTVNIYGKQTKVRGGSTKKVNYQPIMVRSKF
ncbi:MAG TPA: endo-1,4-beta-xylanase [Actinomycetes bacterium]|nr:endo-1,4-beta-xylanase [Actinomycetes bacterium]